MNVCTMWRKLIVSLFAISAWLRTRATTKLQLHAKAAKMYTDLLTVIYGRQINRRDQLILLLYPFPTSCARRRPNATAPAKSRFYWL